MEPTSVVYKYHKVVLYLTTLGLIAYGIMTIINPQVLSAGFHRFTNVDWEQYQIVNVEIASYIILLWRLIGIFNLMAGLVLTMIVWKWMQLGNKWSWIALFIGTILAYLGPMITDLIVGSIEVFEIIEFTLFGLFVIVMLLVSGTYFEYLEEG
ncbi:MAG: hypothetical protein ACXAAO_08665 [Candidatus Thorarchaeota archaeon]|jgi:hypothetical protein